MPENTYNQQPEDPTVWLPLSKYTDMVKRIQKLEDQAEINRLEREKDELEAKRNEVLLQLYTAQQKLKEAGIE